VILIAGAMLVNAALSVLGACVMGFAARAVLGRSSRWAKWIFVLPFGKMVFDVSRGIPSGAFVRSPFAGTRFDQGRFQIGVGIHAPLSPMFHGALEARVGTQWFPLSAGDLAVQAVVLKAGTEVLVVIMAMVVAVSLAFVARRAAAAIAFEVRRRRDRRGASLLRTVRELGRPVDIYLSRAFAGTPFTGGVIRPYVCFPVDSYEALGEGERVAAIEHELAHVRSLDAPLFVVLGVLTDLVWFIPGIQRLLGAVRAEAERAADDNAVIHGADPVHLASAILRLADPLEHPVAAVPFTRPGSQVAGRVRNLLEGELEEPRWRSALRFVVFALLVHATLLSTFVTYP
jgi:beta-lactamase regulating signal transducer with metallopeptidase domain